MKTIKTVSIYLFFAVFLHITIYSQLPSPYGSICQTNYPPGQSMQVGTYCKPESITKYTNLPAATFPTLVVFVQFRNDPGSDGFGVWQQGQVPAYLNTTIARYRNQSYTDWWDAYDQNSAYLSDFWMEVSRGALHVTGQAFHIQLDYEISAYTSMEQINSEIYDKLQPLVTNWPEYDQWGFNKNTGVVTYGADGYIDMIYKVHRYLPPQWYAIAMLRNSLQGENHLIYDFNGVRKYINGNFGAYPSGDAVGSGFMIDGKPVLPQWGMVSFAGHEHGHYLFTPGHQYYSKVNNDFGMEEFFSPYDLLHMGWYQSKKVNYTLTSNYSLNDFSSRNYQPYNNEDEILEVPINEDNEFFLIVNRQKVSTYDKIMWGDTARGIPYTPLNDPNYGKGIYIYHANPQNPDYPWPTAAFDQECADGLWNWEYVEDRNPDWSCTQPVPYYRRTEPVYNYNDPTNYNIYGQSNGLQNRDGKSVNYHFNEGGVLKPYTSWFGLGNTPACEQGMYTDRYWTNLVIGAPYPQQLPMKVVTTREWQGDRWDAWKIGYNEVFSPYSSPSTANWINEQTGIFIYLQSQNGNDANFKIYKVGQPYTLEQILEMTPPAKPMNLKSEFCYQSASFPYYFYNKLTWIHNSEPDMKRTNGSGGYNKRYNIYKVTSANITDLPNENNYSLLATVDIDEFQVPSYIDYSEPSGCTSAPDIGCPPQCWNLHATRYRIEAVDNYNTPSVKSDFASSLNWTISNIGGGIEDGDSPLNISEIPEKFNLLQNYPNPFNPATEIKFELPQNSFVTLIVYNAIGEEVTRLVNNEYKNAGRYSVGFDGSKLASGIYFYAINAGTFKDVKKMVLIK